MKKLLTFAVAIALTASMFAGGLVTNTNHSAMYTRMQCRDATLGIDAVYFNPAGLTKLSDGFHLSLSNQTIGQTRTIKSDYTLLSGAPETTFIGDVSAPLYPSVYAVYKTGKLAISAGFNVIGGGGGAEYKTGLPSFETGIADVVPQLQLLTSPLDAGVLLATTTDPYFRNITGYNATIYFDGSSTYFGAQANVSYAINDMISLGIGARYVMAKNTYNGSITDVTITSASVMPGVAGTYTPGDYLRTLAAYGNAATAATYNAYAAGFDAGTSVEADVEQTGSGITPIISLNISPSEKFNVAIKYEMQTSLELDTKVNDNKGAGIWTDGEKKIADMPAQLVVGLMYKPTEKLMLTTGVHYYFDKNVDYDGIDSVDVNMIDKGLVEYALGLNYSINEKFDVSAGWLTTITGVNSDYQSDLTYSLNTNTFGGGIGYQINDMINLNLGGAYTIYKDGVIDQTSGIGVPYKLSVDKSVWLFAIGLDLSF